MKLLHVETITSPDLLQVGTFETKSGQKVSVYLRSTEAIRAPEHYDHFFIVGVLAAFLRSEPYQHLGPVDAQLFENMHAVMRQWKSWWRIRPINVSAEMVRADSDQARRGKTGCLLSGGVDSLFTVKSEAAQIDTLINLVHASSPSDSHAAEALFLSLQDFSKAYDKSLIGVETNVMYAFSEIEDSWAPISHGACLAAVGHFLGAELGELMVSSSFAEDQLRPWGSHPLTDPLMSSSTMMFRHKGEAYNRFEKHQEIVRDPVILRHLSVCEHGPQQNAHINCSNCQKCLRSMITMDLLGVRAEDASSFDWSSYEPAKLKQYLLQGHVNCSELLEHAQRGGREEIANVLRDVIAYSEQYRWIVQLELFLRRRFNGLAKYKRPLKRLRAAVYGLMNIRTRRL